MKTTISPSLRTFKQELKKCCARDAACAIAYRHNNGKTTTMSSQIIDLFSWQGREYVLIEKGQLICIDRLVSVDDLFLEA